jgi:rhamnosyltransferase
LGLLKASAVIPTLNAGPGFEELLRGLLVRRLGFDYEVFVLDSGSTDGTEELAGRHGARVHQVPEALDREIRLEQER